MSNVSERHTSEPSALAGSQPGQLAADVPARALSSSATRLTSMVLRAKSGRSRLQQLRQSVDLSLRPMPPHNIRDVRRTAERCLPRAVFDFIDGGAEDEVTLERNLVDYRHCEFVPSSLIDVSSPNTVTTMLGMEMAAPIVLAPTGLTRLVHPDGELAVARSAARHGLPYVLSSMGSTSFDVIGPSTAAPKLFQLYVWRDRGRLRELFARSWEAGFTGLQLTVDVPVLGSRDRDHRNGMSIPPKLRLPAALDALRHPRWWTRYLTSDPVTLAAVTAASDVDGAGSMGSLQKYVDGQFDPSVTWSELEWMVSEWPGLFMVKGILTGTDARRCVDAGVDAIVVSNHGGRQLDRVPGALTALRDVAREIGDELPLLVDGGVRRGGDIVAALAHGAAAVQIGRPYLYGLASRGEVGVDRVLEILVDELRRTMALVGRPTIESIDPSVLRASVRGDDPGPSPSWGVDVSSP